METSSDNPVSSVSDPSFGKFRARPVDGLTGGLSWGLGGGHRYLREMKSRAWLS